MFRMAVGHSDDIDLDAALRAVFEECDAGLAGAAPRGGLLHVAWDTDHRAVVDAVRARYPGIALAGSTASGEMSSVIGLSEDSISLALFASDDVTMSAGLGRGVLEDPGAASRQAVEQAMAGRDEAPRLCIVMPSIGGYDASSMLTGLREALGPGVPILGGGSAPEDPAGPPLATESRQLADDDVAVDAVAVMLFFGPLDVSFGVETGWRGVGPRGVVTKVSKDGVLEIDGQPATAFYERYVGLGQPPLGNPMAVFDDDGSGRFYLRTPIAGDPETGLITFFGTVPLGATVQITSAATNEIIDGARASIAQALAGFPAGHQPEAALLYSCATRRFLLGTRARNEIELIRETLGPNVPIAGFYCLGEIAPMASPDATRFHNATMVSVLLGSG